MKKSSCLIAMVICSLLAGCSSVPFKMGPIPGKEYTVVGKGQAEGGGFMLLGIIPIMQNDKFERTYKAAVNQRGGDALINPIITESWFWAYIGNGYRTHIEGDVVKYTD